jgi:uncharacterized small protein (DUF1192 family)
MLLLVGVGLVLILLALPLEKETHKDLFQLLALLITAVITLSSTTFVSNAMAGFMLRGMQSFRLGDFLRVETQFGRVTERGLLHTEIQSEERDLATRSKLRAKMLTTLHEAEIEIVSPSFMNQRQMDQTIRVLPTQKPGPYRTFDEEPDTKAEALIFDKTDAVAQLEELKERREALREEISRLETQVKAKEKTIGPWIERRITRIREEEERLGTLIQKAEHAKIE